MQDELANGSGAMVSRPLVRLEVAALLLVVAIGGAVRTVEFLDPWVGQHNAWGGAYYGNIAQNYVEYGYGQTSFGPVANFGRVEPENFEFYYHYPPLLVLAVSASFHLFGVHEWSARIVPLVFSLATIILLFAFARSLYSTPVALIAALFLAVTPGTAYYGMHVDVYGPISLFFVLFALHFYGRWLDTYRAGHLALATAGLFAGCATAWHAYFLAPLLLAHYWFVDRRHGPNRKAALLLGFVPFAAFGLFILHRGLVVQAGNEVYGTLLEKLFVRIGYPYLLANGELGGVFYRHLTHLITLHTGPVLLLALGWFLLFLAGVRRRELGRSDCLLVVLLAYGAIHNIAFAGLLRGHDFLVTSYSAGFCLAGAVALERMHRFLSGRFGKLTGNLVGTALVVVSVAFGADTIRQLYSYDQEHVRTLVRRGELIQRISDDVDLIVVPSDQDRVFQYYVNREMEFGVLTGEDVQRVVRNAKAENASAYFVCPEASVDRYEPVLAYLDHCCSKRREGDLIIYSVAALR